MSQALLLFAIGLISLLGQVVLLRELAVAFYGIELVYLLALGVWLFLTALGALSGRRRAAPSLNVILWGFAFLGLFVIAGVVFVRASRLIFSGVTGAYLSFPEQLLSLVLALLPVGLLSGWLFRRVAALYVQRGRTLIAAYGIESAGGLAGGLLATACLIWGVQNFALALVCGLIALFTAVVYFSGRKVVFHRTTAFILLAGMAAGLWASPFLDRWMTAWNHPGLLESRDSPYGRITLTKLDGQVSLFDNDALAFETQGTEAESFVHLAALQHPRPESVLILGGGIEGMVREVLQHGPKRVDDVELNPVMMEMVSKALPEDIRESLVKPGVRLISGDPRAFLRQSGRYDLILVGMPEPSSGQSNRFYTEEFFSLCAARLNPGGLIGLRLRSAENLWTPQLTRRTASVYRALTAVFRDVLVLPGATNVITASQEPLPRSAETLTERLAARDIKARLISAPYIRYLFSNDRFFEVAQILKASTVPPNRDARPVCYPYALMIWLSKFFPELALPDLSQQIRESVLTGFRLLALGAAVLILFLFLRRRPSWRNAALVAAAGFFGMVLESVLILHYQTTEGVLYQDIGILLTLFMAGLVLGSLAIHRDMTGRPDRGKRSRRVGTGMLALFALLCLFILFRVDAGGLAGLAPTSALLAGAGMLVAGIFGYASLRDRQDQPRAVSPLYAADLAGGCLGSLLASLVLIPLFGLPATLKGVIILAALSILLV